MDPNLQQPGVQTQPSPVFQPPANTAGLPPQPSSPFAAVPAQPINQGQAYTPQPPPAQGFSQPAPTQQIPGQPLQQAQAAPGQMQPKLAPKANPNSTQNALHIAEIRDGIVIMDDGSFRAVVMCKSINFDLMSPQEREAVEYSYQGFLNSLYFPVQIFIRSQRVDLQPYIDKLDKIRSEHDNMLLALLMEDYINFMDNLSQQTNIMDKKFYVVVPFFKVIDAGKAVAASKSFIANAFGQKRTACCYKRS
jgi:hypothetical protein